MSTRIVTWTPKQQQVADMLRKGMDTKAIIAAGHGRATITRVRAALKKEKVPDYSGRSQGEPGGAPHSQPATIIRPRTLEAIEVGGLIIEPADWRINQFGAFLILTTHDIAKQKYGYEGTVGEFICDAVQVLRQIMGMDIMSFDYLLKEGGNGTEPGEETSQGAGVSEEGREELDGRAGPESFA